MCFFQDGRPLYKECSSLKTNKQKSVKKEGCFRVLAIVNSADIPYMGNLTRNDTNELTYKTGDSENQLMVARGSDS